MLLKVLRPNLIDYINLSKVLDNCTRRCNCTSGESRVGLICGGTSVFLCKTFLVTSAKFQKIFNASCTILRIE